MSDVLDAFGVQSRAAADLGSPFLARLMTLFADRLEPGGAIPDRILGWPGDPSPFGDGLPLRVAGGLHALRLGGDAGLAATYPPNEATDDALWSAVTTAMGHGADTLHRFLDTAPQTNEVRRAAAIAPVLSLLTARTGLPIRLVEIGCSAGLNLRADRFRVTAGPAAYGPSGSAVQLAPEWRGAPAPAPAPPRIAARIGIDIAPIDPVADRTRLLAYLWPDQFDRITRTEAAIDIAASVPAEIHQIDAVEFLKTLRVSDGALTLIFHTIAWQYLPPDRRAEGDALIAALGATASQTAPLARLGMEADGPHARLDLAFWPGQATMHLGNASYHGQWIEWYEA